MRPKINSADHGIGSLACVIKNHDGWPLRYNSTNEPIAQSAIHVFVAKAVAANQDRIGLINMTNERSMKRMKRLDQKLVEFKASCHQRSDRERLTFRDDITRMSIGVVMKL